MRRDSSAATSAASSNAVVVTSCGLPATSASSYLSHPSPHIVASRRWKSVSRHVSTSPVTLDLGEKESRPTPSNSAPLSEKADEPTVSNMVLPDNTPAALQEAPHRSSIAKLRTFLDAESLHDDSRRYTVRHIRHRYLLWKHENVLHHLGPFHMSSIIRLLGSLSISDPGKPFKPLYSHRRLPDMPESNYGPHWDTIIMICRDKQRLQYPLSTSDRYWLMRARIGKYQEYAETSRE